MTPLVRPIVLRPSLLRLSCPIAQAPFLPSSARRRWITASGLGEASKLVTKGESITALQLGGSDDLECRNIMCEKLGGKCICKLERWLQQTGGEERMPELQTIDLSSNGLDGLPPSLWAQRGVQCLDLSGNALRELPAEVTEMKALRELRLHGNPLERLPSAKELVRNLEKLERVTISPPPPPSATAATAATTTTTTTATASWVEELVSASRPGRNIVVECIARTC